MDPSEPVYAAFGEVPNSVLSCSCELAKKAGYLQHDGASHLGESHSTDHTKIVAFGCELHGETNTATRESKEQLLDTCRGESGTDCGCLKGSDCNTCPESSGCCVHTQGTADIASGQGRADVKTLARQGVPSSGGSAAVGAASSEGDEADDAADAGTATSHSMTFGRELSAKRADELARLRSRKLTKVQAIKPRTGRPGERTVLVLYTGGTLGMKPNAEGALEPVPGYLESRMRSMSELDSHDAPALDIQEIQPLIDSSDMDPDDWRIIAKTLYESYLDYDGFVVVLGTDTMAYCATALSFMFEALGKPIICTGSMVPIAELYNDARRNLLVAIILAAYLELPEVGLFMNDSLFRGNRCLKTNSSGLDAFESPNAPALVKLETRFRIRSHLFLPQPRSRLRLALGLCTDIAVLRMVPGFSDDYIYSIIRKTPSLKGVVLQLYGTGNMSARKTELLDAITEAMERGIIVVACSQCIKGSVHLDDYALGRNLSKRGVVSAGDMTTDAAVLKLGYLLGQGFAPAKVTALMTSNLRGEMTPPQDSNRTKLTGLVPQQPHGAPVVPVDASAVTPGTAGLVKNFAADSLAASGGGGGAGCAEQGHESALFASAIGCTSADGIGGRVAASVATASCGAGHMPYPKPPPSQGSLGALARAASTASQIVEGRRSYPPFVLEARL